MSYNESPSLALILVALATASGSGASNEPISSRRITVATLLKQHGYHTVCVGKWHLGLDWTRWSEDETGHHPDFRQPFCKGPLDLGFDYFHGIAASADMPPFVFIENNYTVGIPSEEVVWFGRRGLAAPGFKPIGVMRFDGDTGAYETHIFSSSVMSAPKSLLVGDDYLYVSDGSGDDVRRYNWASQIKDVLVSGGVGGLDNPSTGTNHIDKETLARRRIRLLSITRDYGLLNTFSATAECAWMLLLACHRHFHAATASVLAGRWNGEAFRGRQLLGRTLGVRGVGRLGRMTAEMGKGFRMRVLGCDRAALEIDGVEPVNFDTLLRESDVISIHVHMNQDNHHLFNAEVFLRMKPASILVNTSRGDIIDETALLEALESGRLTAFGADVISNEWRDDIRESPLVQYAMTHDNVVITPHLGGCTYRSLADARVFAARKLVCYLKTGDLRWTPKTGQSDKVYNPY